MYSRNLQLLIGFCCTQNELWTITEYFPRGNLKDYLQTEGDNLVESDLIRLCAQVNKETLNCKDLNPLLNPGARIFAP